MRSGSAIAIAILIVVVGFIAVWVFTSLNPR